MRIDPHQSNSINKGNIVSGELKNTEVKSGTSGRNDLISDTVKLSGKKKPFPAASFLTSEAQPAPDVKSQLLGSFGDYVADISSGVMTGGATGAAVSFLSQKQLAEKLKSLEEKGCKFYTKTSGWLASILTGKRKELTTSQAAEIIQSDQPKKNVEVKSDNLAFLPVTCNDDVMELDAFYGARDLKTAGNHALAMLVSDMEGLGYTFKANIEGGIEKIGTYGAYNLLSGDWKDKPIKREVIVESGGVNIARLSEEKAKNPDEIRKELKSAKDSVSAILQAGKNITLQDISIVGKSIGDTTFSERAAFFMDLIRHCSGQHSDDIKNTYTLVAGKSGTKSEFVEGSSQMIRLIKEIGMRKGIREAQWAFNYMNENLKGKSELQASFHRMLGATGDLNSAIQGLDFIIKIESSKVSDEKEKIFISLVEREKDNEEAIEDYKAIKENLKQGETMNDAAGELFDIMDGLKEKRKSLKSARRGFTYIRQDLAGENKSRETFRKIFRETGDIKETIENMEFLRNSCSSDNPETKEEIFLKILHYVDSSNDARVDYGYISRNIPQGRDLKSAGTFFSDLLSDLKGTLSKRTEAKKAYEFLNNSYKDDDEAINSYRKLLSRTLDAQLSTSIFTELQKPVKNETYESKENAFLKIYESTKDSEKSISFYNTIVQCIDDNENISESTEQFIVLSRSVRYDENETPQEAYKQTKELFKNNHDGFKAFLEIAGSLKSYKETKDAYELLEKPVKNEDYNNRKAVLLDIMASGAPKTEDGKLSENQREKKAAVDAVSNYRVISECLCGSESLSEGAQRFKMILGALSGDAKRCDETRDLFKFITDEMGKGSFPGKEANQVTEELMKILLLTDSIEMAKAQLLHPNSGNNVIEENDDFVIIGGIKVPVKKGS